MVELIFLDSLMTADGADTGFRTVLEGGVLIGVGEAGEYCEACLSLLMAAGDVVCD